MKRIAYVILWLLVLLIYARQVPLARHSQASVTHQSDTSQEISCCRDGWEQEYRISIGGNHG